VTTGSSYSINSAEKSDDGATLYCTAGNNYTDRAGSSRPRSVTRTLSVYCEYHTTILSTVSINKLVIFSSVSNNTCIIILSEYLLCTVNYDMKAVPISSEMCYDLKIIVYCTLYNVLNYR
jgi:hypothetical protein